MRYKIIDIYQHCHNKQYIAQCLKSNSPQFIIVESQNTLCRGLDIIDVDHQTAKASSITGEMHSLNVIHHTDRLERLYEHDTLPLQHQDTNT